MKLITFIFYTCFTISLFSQTTNDSLVCLPEQQVLAAATKLKNAQLLNIKYEVLTTEYKSYIETQDTVIQNLSSIVKKQNDEIEIYKNIINDYTAAGQKQWYNNTKLSFVFGVITGVTFVYITSRFIN